MALRARDLVLWGALATGCVPIPPDRAVDAARPPPLPPTHDAGAWDATTGLEPWARADPGAPPLGGETLIVLHDGDRVATAAPEVDGYFEVTLRPLALTRAVALPRDAEPGRLIEDGAGRVHIVLRRAGAIATLAPDASTPTIRPVCPSPRGVAWRETDDAVIVACLDGTLVVLPASGGDATQRFQLDDDLRDVVVIGDRVLVSRFRSAEVLAVAPDGTVSARWTPASEETFDVLAAVTEPRATAVLVPQVAWRMVTDGHGVVLLHQRERTTAIPGARLGSGVAYYGASFFGGSPIVENVVTRIDPSAPSGTLPAEATTIPTGLGLGSDLAVRSGSEGPAIAVVSTESGSAFSSPVVTFATATGWALVNDATPLTQISAIALAGPDVVVLQRSPLRVTVREPATIGYPTVRSATLARVYEAGGRAGFHFVTSSGLACASCHPEAGDDGHVWAFGEAPPVRTQGLLGGVLRTAPFHWEGDLADFDALVQEVFVTRMGGDVRDIDVPTLESWLDALPVPPHTPRDEAAARRGAALFASAEVGCGDCHVGSQGTDGRTVDVGTGGAFQVPRLAGVGLRTPLMHSGCAATLRDRLTGEPACTGGDAHGRTSQLSAAEIDDLVAYLSSL